MVLFVVSKAVREWVVEARLSMVHVLAGPLVWTLRAALSSVLTTVPPVLDGVVAAAFQPPCNLCPSLAHLSDHLLNQFALFASDGVVVQ